MSNIELLFIHMVNIFLAPNKTFQLQLVIARNVHASQILGDFNACVPSCCRRRAAKHNSDGDVAAFERNLKVLCACFIHQITWLHYIDIIYRLMIPKIIGFVISQYDSNLYLLKFGKVVITIQRHNPSKFSILHMLLLSNIHVLDISYKIGINSDM